MPSNVSQRQTKLTNELRPGEFIMEPNQETLLRVIDVFNRRLTTIERLEGRYAGTSFLAGQQLGRRWEIVPKEEAQVRLLLRQIESSCRQQPPL
ncbi:hypothetical protein [Pseudomonas violetae]|uniref:Uncharacterized protein n=1 Tax=Pseudomonas violetae TaxID=2915813 RepID=A0ABT0ET47_9PSED|nr:hypothetical protein [Pseudomonas violetae]MCK1788621.1 hypothetical protein [Pseudomonas violetae]